MKVTDMKVGKVYRMGYRHNTWDSKFLGYLTGDMRRALDPSLKDDIYYQTGCTNLNELEAWNDQNPDLAVRMSFADPDDGMQWEAYLFNGRWCVGTSADPLRVYEELVA